MADAYKTDLLDLRRMDCMELMRGMEDNAFDLAIVDPPYGIGRDVQKYSPPNPKNTRHGGHKFFEKKQWDNETPEAAYFLELKRVSTNQIIWGANYYPNFLRPSMGWVFWDKLQRGFNSDGELAYTSFNSRLRVIGIQRGALASEGTIHPTQKPIALYNWLLQNYATPGDRILDTHLGSGSIAVACHYKGFHLTGTELDQDYFDGMVRRVSSQTAQTELDLDL